MKRFAHGDTEVWVGVHPKMGVLLFDPRAQVAVSANKVRLYVWSEQRMATFVKDTVYDYLAQTDPDAVASSPFKAAAESYSTLRARFTHCYRCKNDLNSIDFRLCKACRWIKCECDACGCGYQA